MADYESANLGKKVLGQYRPEDADYTIEQLWHEQDKYYILPRTVTKAVYNEDGTVLDYTIKDHEDRITFLETGQHSPEEGGEGIMDASKVTIVDNLECDAFTKALSARQGVILKNMIADVGALKELEKVKTELTEKIKTGDQQLDEKVNLKPNTRVLTREEYVRLGTGVDPNTLYFVKDTEASKQIKTIYFGSLIYNPADESDYKLSFKYTKAEVGYDTTELTDGVNIIGVFSNYTIGASIVVGTTRVQDPNIVSATFNKDTRMVTVTMAKNETGEDRTFEITLQGRHSTGASQDVLTIVQSKKL